MTHEQGRLLLAKAATTRVTVGLDESPRESEQQRNRQVGCCLEDRPPREPRHRDATGRRGVNVHPFLGMAGYRGDPFQLRVGIKDVSVEGQVADRKEIVGAP